MSARGVIRRPFARLRRRRAEESEHGAVAAIVAIMLAGGILLGMGALVVDVGQLYVEKEQLQTGADFASWAVADSCVVTATPANCNNTTQNAIALTYAKANANDGAAAAQVCINGVSCPTWNTAVTCPAMPTPATGNGIGQWAEVRTTTLTSSGGTLVPPTFAGTLIGVTYAGTTVGACGRVNWGPPAMTKVFAMGISLCDWKRMTSSGTVFYGPISTVLGQAGLFTLLGQPPPTGTADSGIPQNLGVQAGCTTPVVPTSPRGYAWLRDTSGNLPDSSCMVSLTVGDSPYMVTAVTVPGASAIATCITQVKAARGAAPLMVPIYDLVVPNVLPLAPQFHIVGFAPFVVTNYLTLVGGVLSGLGSIVSGGVVLGLNSALCGLSNCVVGYFTKTLVPMPRPAFGTGPNYGATVIGRTG